MPASLSNSKSKITLNVLKVNDESMPTHTHTQINPLRFLAKAARQSAEY